MLAQRVKNLSPYIPGEQPKDRKYIKLNANENPYPPSSSIKKALKKACLMQSEKLGLYPDPDANNLRKEIAKMLNETGGVLSNAKKAKDDLGNFKITSEMIFCGNGSDEVLSFVFCSFFDIDRPLILPEHTYSFYPVYCGFYNIPLLKVPLKDNWELDTEKMIFEANKNGSPTIFANPNAPTGIEIKRSEIENMIERCPKDKVFVVDEAYVDFGKESCLPLLKKYENLVIVRTFSKSLSGAGLRLGYAVASPTLIKTIFTVKNSFNHFPVDFLTQVAGKAACKSYSYYAKKDQKIIEERKSLIEFLRLKKWLVIESNTNFIFTKKDGIEGKTIYNIVKQKGILIRHFDTPGIEDFVRITIGTKKQMKKLKEALSSI